jgi:ribosomal protein L15E
VVKGQIAHVDHDATNNDPDNLVWLCLDHHDQNDSRTSQSKGLTISELRH